MTTPHAAKTVSDILLAIHTTCGRAACLVQREFTNERVAALLEDRQIRSQDEEAHRAVYQQKIDELTQRLKQTEMALQRTTKDYILGQKAVLAASLCCNLYLPAVISAYCQQYHAQQTAALLTFKLLHCSHMALQSLCCWLRKCCLELEALQRHPQRDSLAKWQTCAGFAAKRDKQEAEGTAAHASHELQQHQQESQARIEELQQRASSQLQEAKDSSQDKMEGYCTNFR